MVSKRKRRDPMHHVFRLTPLRIRTDEAHVPWSERCLRCEHTRPSVAPSLRVTAAGCEPHLLWQSHAG